LKHTLFITAMILGSFMLKAQHVELGLKAGLNVANVDIPNSSNIDPRLGPYFGGLAHIHLTKEFAIQPEVVFKPSWTWNVYV